MPTARDRLRTVGSPPLWSYPVTAVVITVAVVVAFPFGLDRWPDVVLEGLYFVLAVLIAVIARRLDVGVLDYGLLVFVVGRYLDFLDEVFVEPEPIVEPYLSGFLMVVSLCVVLVGVSELLEERRERVAELEAKTTELSLKNEAMDEAPVGITIADMTQEDEPLVSINRGFLELTGYDADEMLGRNCRFLQGDATRQEPVAQMRAAIENQESVQVTLRNYRKDGTMFWNEVTLAPVSTEDGDAEHYVGFQQDVTQRKEYERRLEAQRDDLHLLNEMVRHDIRNDLQVIMANIDVLQDRIDEEASEHLATAADSTRSAVALTETARDLAETMLQNAADGTALSLRAVIDDEVDEIRSLYQTVTVDVRALPDVTVEADEMLDSVFRNVLKNAVQHNDTDTPEITVSATRTDGSVVVSIADNGPGVPDEMKTDVFGRGEKGLESRGTGIGMYLVDTLVTQYGGDVWIEDNDPRGAVFKIELPVAE